MAKRKQTQPATEEQGQAYPDALDEDQQRTEGLRALAEGTAVADVMTKAVVCLAPEATLESVTDLFLRRGISGAPVVDDNWIPTGVITKTDLLRSLADEETVSSRTLHGGDVGAGVGLVRPDRQRPAAGLRGPGPYPPPPIPQQRPAPTGYLSRFD